MSKSKKAFEGFNKIAEETFSLKDSITKFLNKNFPESKEAGSIVSIIDNIQKLSDDNAAYFNPEN